VDAAVASLLFTKDIQKRLERVRLCNMDGPSQNDPGRALIQNYKGEYELRRWSASVAKVSLKPCNELDSKIIKSEMV